MQSENPANHMTAQIRSGQLEQNRSKFLPRVSLWSGNNDDGGCVLQWDIPVLPHRKTLGWKHLDKVHRNSC